MVTDCNKTHYVKLEPCGKATTTVTELCAIHLLHLHFRISEFSAVLAVKVLVVSQHYLALNIVHFKSCSYISCFPYCCTVQVCGKTDSKREFNLTNHSKG